MTMNNFQRIINYIELIKRKPKQDVKFFNFDDSDRKFIVDGNKFKLLPFKYYYLYEREEFYIHVNIIDKKIMYYAFDVESHAANKHINEEEGYMNWDEVETCVYNFFALNIKLLTDIATPYSEINEPKSKPMQASTQLATHTHSYHDTSYYNTGYGSASYKEREAFYDKLWAFLKENKTSQAIDHIVAHFEKMCQEKKFEDIDSLLRIISFDKLTAMTMIAILDATNEVDDCLKARKDFFEKVKVYLKKVKPTRANLILHHFNTKIEKEIQISKSN